MRREYFIYQCIVSKQKESLENFYLGFRSFCCLGPSYVSWFEEEENNVLVLWGLQKLWNKNNVNLSSTCLPCPKQMLKILILWCIMHAALAALHYAMQLSRVKMPIRDLRYFWFSCFFLSITSLLNTPNFRITWPAAHVFLQINPIVFDLFGK